MNGAWATTSSRTLGQSWQGWVDVGVGMLVLLTFGLALLAGYLLWRDGFLRGWRRARQAPPTCPRCGYNLSGLLHCRCPECGEEYTLDRLWRFWRLSSRSVPKPVAQKDSLTRNGLVKNEQVT